MESYKTISFVIKSPVGIVALQNVIKPSGFFLFITQGWRTVCVYTRLVVQ